MKLLIDYNTTSKGYQLSCEVDIEAAKDAEALGYSLVLVNALKEFIEEVIVRTASKELPRLWMGAELAKQERINNETWPFDKTMTTTKPNNLA